MELAERCAEMGIPCSFANNYEQLFDNVQSRHRGVAWRGVAIAVGHPYDPELRYIADPIFYCETPLYTCGVSPLPGEHNDEELRERIGLGPEEITTLRARGII